MNTNKKDLIAKLYISLLYLCGSLYSLYENFYILSFIFSVISLCFLLHGIFSYLKSMKILYIIDIEHDFYFDNFRKIIME